MVHLNASTDTNDSISIMLPTKISWRMKLLTEYGSKAIRQTKSERPTRQEPV